MEILNRSKFDSGAGVVYSMRLTHDLQNEVRYVGKTIHGVNRLKAHVRSARNPNSSAYGHPKSRWMRKHYYQITFEVLEVVDDVATLGDVEMKWIYILESKGHRLLNCTKGGDGMSGWKMSEEQREAISKNMSGTNHWAYGGGKFSAEHRRNLSKASSGTSNGMYGVRGVLHPRYGTDMSGNNNPMFGRKHSTETKEKISAAQKGVPANLSTEGRAVVSTTARKTMHTRWHVNRGIINENCLFCTRKGEN